MQQRYARPVKIFDQRKLIQISDAWLEKLSAFDFKSKLSKFRTKAMATLTASTAAVRIKLLRDSNGCLNLAYDYSHPRISL